MSKLDVFGFGLFQGTIDIDFINGFAPLAGQSFDIIDVFGGADFSGATLKIGGVSSGFQYTDTFSNNSFTLTAETNGVSTPEPGSFWLLLGVLGSLSAGALYRRTTRARRAA